MDESHPAPTQPGNLSDAWNGPQLSAHGSPYWGPAAPLTASAPPGTAAPSGPPPGYGPPDDRAGTPRQSISFDAPLLEQRKGRAGAEGNVADLRQRIETHRRLPTIQIVNFRLERYDERGNRLQPVPVELRGITITGHIANGERVQVEGKYHNGTLYTDLVKNVTTGGGISSQATGRLGRRIGRRGVLLTVLTILLALVLCVRFIPSLWINTPFGLSEYQDEVKATCTALSGPGAPNLVPRSNNDGTYSRSALLGSFDTRVDNVKEQLRLLLSHTTPIIRQSRRDKLAAFQPQINAAFVSQRRRLVNQLPVWFTLAQFNRVTGENGRASAVLTSELNDALSQLSGGECGGT